ncbi:MAG: DUF4925 domain-containing protein [Muribaculaceae bacterium]|nr:DUF4925 domain-containing protein [Muribaculaceae bacterium]
MKIKHLFILISLVFTLGFGSCSQDTPNPEDYTSSILSGEYAKDGLWKLLVYENGNPISDYGSVIFASKDLEEADITFINVIPNNSRKEFHNVPLTSTDQGLTFSIEEVGENTLIKLNGIVKLGEMTIHIDM